MHFAIGNWCALLELAKSNGWEPEGGEYTTNEDRHVSDLDAANIADALQAALPQLDKVNPREFLGRRNPLRIFSGEGYFKLLEFISLCRRSGFVIE
jgi:hypothetical protein